ncbi:MAG: YitT family protein [Lachnospiraceae bacterium]|nr:YitT family protein [Lachnospiraceae bacterium]
MKKTKFELFFDYLMLTAGAALAALAIEEFLAPCMILDGGVIGIAMMISNFSHMPLGVLTVVLNLPFILIGYKKMGAQFILKSGYAMVVFSAFTAVFEPLANATSEYLLAVSFGGLILGFGVGLVIRYGGCLDGTETVAIMLNRKYKMSVGKIVLAINVLIYLAAGMLFGIDRALYSLLTYAVTSRIIDFVEIGMEQAKAAMIITSDAKEISEKIYSHLGRTVTIMEGEGLVSGKKVVLYCVVTRFEIRELRDIISSVDTSAFVAISDVSEIIGAHIKSRNKENGDKEIIL